MVTRNSLPPSSGTPTFTTGGGGSSTLQSSSLAQQYYNGTQSIDRSLAGSLGGDHNNDDSWYTRWIVRPCQSLRCCSCHWVGRWCAQANERCLEPMRYARTEVLGWKGTKRWWRRSLPASLDRFLFGCSQILRQSCLVQYSMRSNACLFFSALFLSHSILHFLAVTPFWPVKSGGSFWCSAILSCCLEIPFKCCGCPPRPIPSWMSSTFSCCVPLSWT